MLAFRRFDTIVAHPGSPPDGNASVLVCWELVTQHSGLDKITFRVERSLSPQFSNGEFVELEREIPGVDGVFVYEYDDVTPNLFNWWRKYYYRIVASTPDGEIESQIRTWETSPRPHELAIIERHDFVLKFIQGSPAFAFIERTAESAPCSCYNRTTGRPTDSRCTMCLGTGRQRPYFEPVPFFVDFNPDEKMVSISNLGERQPKDKDCWFSAYPQIKPGDLLYEVMPAVLWRVGPVHTIQPQGTTIQHVCRLSAVGREEVEYQYLPQRISPDTLRAVVQEWERVKQQRMF
jgi:hypothetical protein